MALNKDIIQKQLYEGYGIKNAVIDSVGAEGFQAKVIFLHTEDGKYVSKWFIPSKPNNELYVSSRMDFVRFLSDNNISVPHVVPTLKGDYYYKLDGSDFLYLTIYPFLEGKVLFDVVEEEGVFSDFVEALAYLHSVSRKYAISSSEVFAPPMDISQTIHDMNKLFLKRLEENTLGLSQDQKEALSLLWGKSLTTMLELEKDATTFEQNLPINGDLSLADVLVGDSIHFLDFDMVKLGDPIEDIAKLVVHWIVSKSMNANDIIVLIDRILEVYTTKLYQLDSSVSQSITSDFLRKMVLFLYWRTLYVFLVEPDDMELRKKFLNLLVDYSPHAPQLVSSLVN